MLPKKYSVYFNLLILNTTNIKIYVPIPFDIKGQPVEANFLLCIIFIYLEYNRKKEHFSKSERSAPLQINLLLYTWGNLFFGAYEHFQFFDFQL